MGVLFALDDLPSILHVPSVDNSTAERVRRFASGWLRSATGLMDWPDPVPDDLWAWAVELAVMVHENPTWAEREAVGSVSVQFGAMSARRREIMDEARAAYGLATMRNVGKPRGYFPVHSDWPDSVEKAPTYP